MFNMLKMVPGHMGKKDLTISVFKIDTGCEHPDGPSLAGPILGCPVEIME